MRMILIEVSNVYAPLITSEQGPNEMYMTLMPKKPHVPNVIHLVKLPEYLMLVATLIRLWRVN